jgi:hypothetical protein
VKFPTGMKKAIKQKMAKFAKILGKFKQHFKSTWIQNPSRIKHIMHWLFSSFYIEGKFGPTTGE